MILGNFVLNMLLQLLLYCLWMTEDDNDSDNNEKRYRNRTESAGSFMKTGQQCWRQFEKMMSLCYPLTSKSKLSLQEFSCRVAPAIHDCYRGITRDR